MVSPDLQTSVLILKGAFLFSSIIRLMVASMVLLSDKFDPTPFERNLLTSKDLEPPQKALNSIWHAFILILNWT